MGKPGDDAQRLRRLVKAFWAAVAFVVHYAVGDGLPGRGVRAATKMATLEIDKASP